MKAAALLDVREARVPERRAFEDREIRALRRFRAQLCEAARHGKVLRQGHVGRAAIRLEEALSAGRQWCRQRVPRVAGAVDERADVRIETVHDPDRVALDVETEALAGRAKSDLLEVGRRSRLNQASGVALQLAELHRV